MNKKGFTLIELLVTIAIIAILAGLVLIRVVDASNQAKITKTKADLSEIRKSINIAKSLKGTTLHEITNNWYSQANCYSQDLRNIGPGNQCYDDMKNAFDKIQQAGGIGIQGSPPKDAWGSPYLIDENEGDDGGGYYGPCRVINGQNCCSYPTNFNNYNNRDFASSAGPNGIIGGGDDLNPGYFSIDNVVCPNY